MDKRTLDLTGRQFGSLTVTAYAGPRRRAAYWHCTCACGALSVVRGGALTTGQTSSCGCARKRNSAAAAVARATHGMTCGGQISRIYRIWTNMRSRCNNPNFTTYKWYGAKGVRVCARWDKFENFLADMGVPADHLTLDRINPFGDYEPSNCRWATWKEQGANKRRNYQPQAQA